MCKVLVKKVRKEDVRKGVSKKSNKPWQLHIFECVVDVDSTGKEAVRTVKTFDAKMAEKIRLGEGQVFEAKKEGEESPFTYLVESGKKQYKSAPVKSNRAVALELAYKLAPAYAQEMAYSGEADPALLRKQIFQLAEDNLAWLEGKEVE